MAVADLYYGFVSFIDMLLVLEVIVQTMSIEKQEQIHDWKITGITLSFNSSLFHILLITLDRFVATTFPLFHKVHVRKNKIIATVCCIWVLAIFLGLLPLNSDISPKFPTWSTAIMGSIGCLILVYTYTHISIVAMKRRNKLKSLQRTTSPSNEKAGSSKSINTTFLSVSITVLFIACNSYGIVHAVMYALDLLTVTNRIFRTSQLLLCINSAVNPILYTIVEVVHKRFVVGKQPPVQNPKQPQRQKQPEITNGQMSGQSEQNGNLGKSVESVATLASVI